MSGFIGKVGKKAVLLTRHASKRLGQRNLNRQEVLDFLERKDFIRFPPDANGVRKVRGTVRNKKIFLAIWEDDSQILIITGGESNAAD